MCKKIDARLCQNFVGELPGWLGEIKGSARKFHEQMDYDLVKLLKFKCEWIYRLKMESLIKLNKIHRKIWQIN